MQGRARFGARGYGATAVRRAPDHKLGNLNVSAPLCGCSVATRGLFVRMGLAFALVVFRYTAHWTDWGGWALISKCLVQIRVCP